MITTISMLACGDMNIHLTAGENALIFYIIGSWFIGILLFFVNVAFIIDLKTNRSFKVANAGFLLIYAFLTLALYSAFSGGLWHIFSDSSWAVPVLIFGIPVMVIAHSVFLFCVRRRSLNKQSLEDKFTQCNPTTEQPKAIQPPSLAAGVTADEKLAPLVGKSKDATDSKS